MDFIDHDPCPGNDDRDCVTRDEVAKIDCRTIVVLLERSRTCPTCSTVQHRLGSIVEAYGNRV